MCNKYKHRTTILIHTTIVILCCFINIGILVVANLALHFENGLWYPLIITLLAINQFLITVNAGGAYYCNNKQLLLSLTIIIWLLNLTTLIVNVFVEILGLYATMIATISLSGSLHLILMFLIYFFIDESFK